MTGVVRDAQRGVVPGATVTAVHVPSGTSYDAVTQADGRFMLPNIRVGGTPGPTRGRATRRTGSTTLPGNQIVENIVLLNEGLGSTWIASGVLTRPMTHGFQIKGGYTYGVAKNTVDPRMVTRLDLSLMQDVFHDIGRRRHSGQIRLDITNVGNL